MLDSLISLYAPHQCIGCQTEGGLLCASCERELPVVAPRCYNCRKLSNNGRTCQSCRRMSKLYGVQAVTAYEGFGKELIGRLKFSGARGAAITVAHAMNQLSLSENSIIVPVPTATQRVRLRGYDQATLIAKALALQTGHDYAPSLRRLGQLRQVGASRVQRLKQIRNSFIVWNSEGIQGRDIVLVDDVMTTGATLESAAATLKAAGGKRVEAVVFARA